MNTRGTEKMTMKYKYYPNEIEQIAEKVLKHRIQDYHEAVKLNSFEEYYEGCLYGSISAFKAIGLDINLTTNKADYILAINERRFVYDFK